MKFTAFKAGDGDCILIRGEAAHILVDGGRKGAFVDHALPELEALAAAGEALDLVCVSHIDEDHITGIVDLIRRRREWGIFEYHESLDDDGGMDEPDFARVPKIRELWHNSFGDTFRDASGGVSNALGFHAQLLGASTALQESLYDPKFGRLAHGAKMAIELELLLAHSPMGILLNGPAQPAADKPRLLVLQEPPTASDVNGVQVHLIGPTLKNFEDSFGDWDKWVKANAAKIEQMKDAFSSEFPTANALDFLAHAAKQAGLGNINDVTPPNIASIMFVLEEGGRRIVMTGDGASQDIVKGLEAATLMPADGGLHVDLLKVPHHGAEANLHPDLAVRLTADHYVFTSNGSHHNPETEVIEAVVAGRLGPTALPGPQKGRPFKLWFNYSEQTSELQGSKKSSVNRRKVMKDAADEVARLQGLHPNAFEATFVDEGPVEIDLPAIP